MFREPGVHGAILTEALASRLAVHIEVTTDFTLARSLGVPGDAVTVARTLNQKLRRGEIDWAPYADDAVMPQMTGRPLVEIGAKPVSVA